jgi:hypothetical protein
MFALHARCDTCGDDFATPAHTALMSLPDPTLDDDSAPTCSPDARTAGPLPGSPSTGDWPHTCSPTA